MYDNNAVNYYIEVFKAAASDGQVDKLNNLWEEVEIRNMQHEVLEADGYRAFILAVSSGHTSVLDSLWKKAKSLNLQREMLEPVRDLKKGIE